MGNGEWKESKTQSEKRKDGKSGIVFRYSGMVADG
jgi:hypothetical protein